MRPILSAMLASNSLSAFSASNIQPARPAGPVRQVRDQASAKQAAPAQSAGTGFQAGAKPPAPGANLPRGSLLNLSV